MKPSIVFVAALVSCLALSSHAQAPAASAGPAKIAVVSFEEAVTQTNEFQRNFADLQKKFDPQRQHLKALGEEIDRLTKELQAQGENLSDAEGARRAKTIDDKKKQAQRLSEDAQNDFQQEMQGIFNATASKVGDVLTSYAEQQGYTLVLDRGQQQAQVVLYALPSTDITKVVVDAYNLKSGVPAQPAQSLPSAPKPAPHAPTAH